MYQGSLQLEAEGSAIPVSESDTFEQSVTSRPTLSPLVSNVGELLNRTSDFLGEGSPRTASKPVTDEPQPDFPVIA